MSLRIPILKKVIAIYVRCHIQNWELPDWDNYCVLHWNYKDCPLEEVKEDESVYIADNGKEFDSHHECDKYKYLLNRPWLKTIEFYDKHGERIFINKKEYSLAWSNNGFYEVIERIVIHNDNELVDFMNFAHDAGYMSFETINSVGEWKMNYETYNMERVGE